MSGYLWIIFRSVAGLFPLLVPVLTSLWTEHVPRVMPDVEYGPTSLERKMDR
jgi:hypothetical protein